MRIKGAVGLSLRFMFLITRRLGYQTLSETLRSFPCREASLLYLIQVSFCISRFLYPLIQLIWHNHSILPLLHRIIQDIYLPMETFSKDLEDAIIRDYRTCISINGYFVNFGDYEDLWPEIQTHMHVAAFAESLADMSRPRIPKVF
jgi:hypothetical protein